MNDRPMVKNAPDIDATQLKAFMNSLPLDIRLIADTYKFSSEMYAWIGLSFRWVELFALSANTVDDGVQPTIRLERCSDYGSNGERFFLVGLPIKLGRKLVTLARAHADGLLFCQKDGKAFNSVILAQEFRIASQKAREKKVIQRLFIPSDLQTTPRSDILFERGSLPSICFRSELIKAISEEKVREIASIILPTHCNAGRHRDHSLHNILQALLVQEDFNLTREEFQRHFPGIWSATESQKRRWIDKGLWPRILEILDR